MNVLRERVDKRFNRREHIKAIQAMRMIYAKTFRACIRP